MKICKFWYINLYGMCSGSEMYFGLKVQIFNNFQSHFSPFRKMTSI